MLKAPDRGNHSSYSQREKDRNDSNLNLNFIDIGFNKKSLAKIVSGYEKV
jgi:hypothetical protein